MMGPVSSPASNAAGETAPARPDGRRASRERNRVAVVDALLDLYAEGNLRPGAGEVARRAGLSRRSVFRYFDDLDDLDRTAIARQQERVRSLWDVPATGEGPLAGRIAAAAERRLKLFEAVAPAARVARMRAPLHRVIAQELAESRRLFARQLERQFAPELDALDAADRARTLALLDVICSFESYDLMRTVRDMSPAQARDAMAEGIRAILSCS